MEELDLNMDFFKESEENELDDLFKSEEVSDEHVEKNKVSEASKNNEPEDVAEEEDEEVVDKDPTISEMYSSLANLLTEKGLLSTSKEIKTEEDFVEAFKENIKNSELSDLTDVQKRYLESIRDGVSDDVFLQYENNSNILNSITIEDIENEENETLRSDLIKQSFLLKGFDEDKAIKLTKRIIDSGEDVDEAKDAYKEIVQYNKEKFEKEKAEAKKQKDLLIETERQRLNSFKEKVTSSTEIIKGIKINKQIKDKVIDAYTKIAGYTNDGKPYNKIAEAQLKDPVDFQFKVAYLFSITDGFKDFSAFTTKASAQSSAERQLAKILKSTTADLGGISSDNDDDHFGIDDIKDLDL